MVTAGEYVISQGSNDTMVCKIEGRAENDIFFSFLFFFSPSCCVKSFLNREKLFTGGNGDQTA